MSLKTWSHADSDLENIESLSCTLDLEPDAPVEYSRLESR